MTIRRRVFVLIWLLVVLVLLVLSFQYKDSRKAMVALVESQVTSISYSRPVRIKQIYVIPGQEVDSGDLLLEVDRTDLLTDIRKRETERHQLELRIQGSVNQYFAELERLLNEINIEVKKLEAQKDEIQLQIRRTEESSERMKEMTNLNMSVTDSSSFIELDLIDQQVEDWRRYSKVRNDQLKNRLFQDTMLLNTEIRIIDDQIQELQNESAFLVGISSVKGTIGTVNATLNELVPPYKTILSIYDLKPTMIRAFADARSIEDLQVGAEVTVMSTNREYSITGKIKEIGNRITSYPEKINPTPNQRSYGQEVFVQIPTDNIFLNGERVFVYLNTGSE